MIDIAPQNKAFYWSTFFFRELYDNDIRHIVISPGSRSTPLVLAAAAHDGLEKQVILDERSAAFFALGIGKATGIPAILLCTSGTALANYYPAVIEARLSGIPLILATADRPPHLRHTGANQAIDQLKFFGDYPVFFHEAGEPVLQEKDLNRLTLLADQAVSFSKIRQGPVHLNFPFRKPLEPSRDFLAQIKQENRSLLNRRHPKTIAFRQDVRLPEEIRRLIIQAKRPVIISGPLSPACQAQSISKLAKTIQAPLLSEGIVHSENMITGYDGFLHSQSARDRFRPDLILRFGFQPTSKTIEHYLKHHEDITHIHFAPSNDWQDETFSTTYRLRWTSSLADLLPVSTARSPDWITRWKEAAVTFTHRKKQLMESETTLTDGHVYHYLTPQISAEWNIFASNSFPARDSLLFGRFYASSLFVNRGASGIDGITSTAMGVSRGNDQPLVLFTGDLAFLYDTNALLNHHLLTQPIIIIVLNNRGGNIFRMLPIGRHKKYYQPYFETPQAADLCHLAQTYDIPFKQIKNLEELKKLDLRFFAERQSNKIRIIECVTDSESSMNLREALWSLSDET